MKKVLITGITGFVGPHLANLLIEKGDYKVYGMVRNGNGMENDIRDVVPDENFSKITFLFGNLLDRDSIKRIIRDNKFDWIFHIGAQSHIPTSFKQPQLTFMTNAFGTVNIVDAIQELNPECRMMNCSTSEVYGAVPEKDLPITEDTRLKPINPYGVSKTAADLYSRERAISAGLNIFCVRAFSHTGSRRGKTFSISSDAYQIARINKGLQDPIILVGTLSSRRVVMDVRDCVKAYYALMLKAQPGEAYNVASEELNTMGGFLNTMLDISGLRGKVELKINPDWVRPIDIPIQVADTSKCKQLTGWEPKIPIEQTLTDLLEYWENKIKE